MTTTTTLEKAAAPAEAKPESKPGSRSIKEWCRDRRYSVPSFYHMEKRGVAPQVTRLPGAAPRITDEADREWLKFTQNLPADIIAEVKAISAERRARTAKAAKKAVRSPKHVSHRRRETV